ncbi:carboxymuconolactone decarboxylase family protein [Williamsia deligens]|uniref:Carboxymuconolactone decarboxylase family protein n=1 Tax=Williamsia deligens TaxID=321325 RepID=A0ABW3G663_9NOCA|nr:carboxymuconolactone decarboxylase family protein [Williamsia deligens]MCP2193626.1 4-carboxymuconolactone decarboxylase [Williamsia deligens]
MTSDRLNRGQQKLAEFTSPDAMATHSRIDADLHAIAPDLSRYITEFAYGDIYTRPGLTNQQRAIITLSSLATQGTDPQVELHVNTALTAGVTPTEIVETVLHLIPDTGFPRVINALTIVKKVLSERHVRPTDWTALRNSIARHVRASGFNLSRCAPMTLAMSGEVLHIAVDAT